MHSLYLVSVWLHVVAAAAWVGGMLFMVLVLVPAIRGEEHAKRTQLIRATGRRFRRIGWHLLVALLLTGIINMHFRGVLSAGALWGAGASSAFVQVLYWKLGAVLLTLVLSVLHDFYVGPRASELLLAEPRGLRARRYRRAATWMGRCSLLLGLLLVWLGVVLVRGA